MGVVEVMELEVIFRIEVGVCKEMIRSNGGQYIASDRVTDISKDITMYRYVDVVI